MATNKDDTDDAESTENAPKREKTTHDTADDGPDEADTGRGILPLSRRDAILTGIGVGGLGLFGSQSASADHHHPLTQWQRHQTAQEKYSLIDLAGLNMAVMPHDVELEDFEGKGLDIEDSKLTVDFGSGALDRRYLSWNDGDDKLDFSGAAEWENEVDDYNGSNSPNSASGTAAVAGGGNGNDASGDYSAIPGGQGNNAGGNHSFAAGDGADAGHDGSFVWATGGDSSRGPDSVLFQASGGAFLAEGDLDIEDGKIGAETDVAARTGDVSADSGSVTAENDVTANTGDVTADSGSVVADADVTARTGNVTAGNNVTANAGDVTADNGSVVADADVSARNGHVEADSGNVIANEDVIARTGDVKSNDGNIIADNNVESTFGDIKALSGDVEGEDLIANNEVETETIFSHDDLTLDPAGLDVISDGNLEVQGDLHVTGTKHFSTAVDTPSGPKQVTYTSVEAGKPRTEASDVAELEDGRAEIELPEHFAMVTSDEKPLSVQVTPYAQEQVHPQVTERSLDRIVVEDMGDGPDAYSFAYTVKGVRKGYEDTEALRET